VHQVILFDVSICSVLQCVAVCCSVMQCVAVCCSMLQCVRPRLWKRQWGRGVHILQCVAVCCSVLWGVAVYCSGSASDLSFERDNGGERPKSLFLYTPHPTTHIRQGSRACCSMFQYVAVCQSALQGAKCVTVLQCVVVYQTPQLGKWPWVWEAQKSPPPYIYIIQWLYCYLT